MTTFNCNACAYFGSNECMTCTEIKKPNKKKNSRKNENKCKECKHFGKFTCRRCNV